MTSPDDYCREIEAYLCRKNDGHLVRIVGPAFEQVSQWAMQGIPLNVAFAGIDRYFERYYRRGPRRRPVRIEFCEADVLDAFDAWRRAVGVAVFAPGSRRPAPQGDGEAGTDGEESLRGPRRVSLASHIERVVARVTALRASGSVARGLDEALERTARALDALQPDARRVRGEARDALIDQLLTLDRALIAAASNALDPMARRAVEDEARQALAPFRDRMPPDAFQRACAAALEASVRARFALPTIRYEKR